MVLKWNGTGGNCKPSSHTNPHCLLAPNNPATIKAERYAK
jgi:hypothetical protein